MGSTGVLTDLTNAQIKANINILQGKVVTQPALLISDGTNTTYCCDVDVSMPTLDGRYDQTTAALTGVPGTKHYTADDSLTIGTIIRNVPIANNNGDLRYASVGNAVILNRSASGGWQITGFSQEIPGTRTRVPVDLGNMAIGTGIDLTINGRFLTFGELHSLGGGFGRTPLGITALFRGGTLIETSGQI